MKNIKKFLSVFLAVLFLAIGPTNFSVYAEETSSKLEKQSNEMFLTEEDVFEALSYTFNDQELKKSINSQKLASPSGALIDGFDANSYSEYTNDEYGGMYLNENGVLVLCYVSGSNTLKASQNISNNQLLSKTKTALINSENEVICNYTIKEVQYSEKELLDAYDIINNLAESKDEIKTVDIDVFKNRIIIGVSTASDISLINDNLAVVDGMYAFEILDDDFEVQNTATISSTTAINNGSISSSPAGKLYSSSLGKYGIITCGHGWSLGNGVYKGSTKIGYVKYRNYNTKNDSSFILLYSGHSYSDTYHDEFDSSTPVVGSTLTLRGYKSGKIYGAKVLSTYSSATCEGMFCTGMIRCNKKVQPGDSGGGAVGKIIDGGRTALIVAINKAISTNNTYLIKGKVICDAYK